MFEILLITALVILIIGSVTDLKTREVPDWVNYGGIILGIGLRSFFSAQDFDWSFLAEGLIGLGLAFIVAQLMYRLGQWGGGDSKMIMALGALLGVKLSINYITTTFAVNLLVVGAIYGIGWSIYLGIKNKKSVMKQIKKIWQKTACHRIAAYLGFILLTVLGFLLDHPARLIVLFLSFGILFLIFLCIYMKGVENASFLKRISVKKLAEGDWIAKAVKLKNKIICGPKDLGVSKEQIRKLKQLKIPAVWIKEGIPFIPSFLLAYLASLLIGNLVIKVVELIL